MGRWLVAAAVLIPIAAQADPTSGNPPYKEGPIPTAYAVRPPTSHAHLSDGWGLYATMSGHSMNLNSRDGWADDPRVQPRDVEAGYGFRRGLASAMIGYQQHDFGPKHDTNIAPVERNPDLPPPVRSNGVLGLSLVLRAR
jgi:hypothetical protein